MKTIRKGLLMLLLCVFTLAMGVFAVACSGNKATVSFDTDGGSTVASMTVVPGEDFRLPVPERDGYVFDGWYDNEGRTGTAYTSTAKVDKDTTFYAKWLRGYTLTLDLDEGEYNGESEISFLVGAGKKLLEARYEGSPLSDVQPYKDSVEFGAWFDENDAEVTDSYVMPSRDCTIKAKYVVYYTIEIHTQTAPHGEEYEVDEDNGYVNGQGYVNELLAVTAPTVEHYEYDAKHAGTVSSLTLTTDTKNNLFVLYYDRATYRVIYNSNAPQNTEVTGEMHDTTFVYGEEGTIARCKFQIEGHRLAGWAESASGSVSLQSGDKLEAKNYNLFAVWDAGYRDLLGGSDYIYFPRTMNGGVILFRAEHEFVGTRKTLNGEGAYVDDANGNYVDFGNGLIAKLDSKNMTFVFFYEDRVGDYEYYAPYENSTEEDILDVKISLQGYELGTIEENGVKKNFTYYFDDEKNSFMMQVDGEKTARPFVFGVQDEKLVFTFRGEEMGEYLLYRRTSAIGYTVGAYSYLYDGVGGVSLCDAETGEPILTGIYYKPTKIGSGNELTTYLCVDALIDGDRHDVVLTSFSSGTDTIPGAILKVDSAVGDFTRTTDDGKTETLTLSGYSGYNGAVIYKDGDGNETKYDCFTEESVLGTVLHVLTDDPTTTQTEAYTFLLTATYKYDGTIEEGKFQDYKKFTQYIYLLTPDGVTNTYSNQTLVIFDGEEITFTETLEKTVPTGEQDEDGRDIYRSETYEEELRGYAAAIYTTEGNFPGYVTKGEYASKYSHWDLNPNPLYHFEADVDVEELSENEQDVFNNQHIYKNFYTTFEFQTLELNIGQSFYVYKSLDKYSAFNYGVYGTKVKEGEQGVSQQRILMTINPVLATYRGSGFEGYTAYYWASEDAEPIQGSMEMHLIDYNAATNGFVSSSAFYTFYYFEGNSTELKQLHFSYHADDMFDPYIEFFDYVPKTMARTLTVTRRVGAISLSESYISMIMKEDGKTAYYFTSAANYIAGNAIQGTYSEVGRTQLNGIKYLFTPDNLEDCDPFEFIYEERIGSDEASYVDVVRYCDERWRDYSATLEDGSTVTLDGYGHYARYTTNTGLVFEGNYIFFTDADDKFTQFAIYTPTGRSITLQATIATDEDGNFLSLKLEERADYYLLFASDYWFPAGFDQAIVVFNSKDNTFIMPEYGAWVWYNDWEQGIINDPSWDPGEYKNLMKATGTYELVDEDDLLFVLHCNLMKDGKETGAKRDMYVRMMFNGNEAILLLQDDNIVGSYVGPNNEVVYIDGYGQSFFVDDHGNRREGVYTYISDNPNNSNYQYVAFDDGEVCYVMIFDQENGTFTIGNKEEDYQTFYSDNFDSVEYTQVFSVNGDAIGYWFFDSSSNNEFKLYEANFNEETSFTYSLSTQYDYPDKEAESIELGGTEYFRFKKDTKYSLSGSLVFDAFLNRDNLHGNSATWGGMKLDFVPDGTNALNAPATFTFTKDGQEEVYGNLTIRKEVVNVLQGKTATIIKLYQKNNPYGFRLELDRNPESGKDGFTLHAAATEAEFPDYSVEMLGGVGYYQMTYGTKYSIGVKDWDISDWGFDPEEWIVSIVFNAADKNNKILTVDVIYSEYFQLAQEGSGKKGGHIITEDKTGYIPAAGALNVWEIPFVASDGYTYSAWMEVLNVGYQNGRPVVYSALYALNIKKTFKTHIGKTTETGVEDVTNGTEVQVTTQQFECAYWGLLTYGSVYTIGIEKTDSSHESLIDEQALGNWVDDLIILYWNENDTSKNTDEDTDYNYPADKHKTAYVVKVERDEHDVIKGARIDESDYRIVKSSSTVKCEAYTDENGDEHEAMDTLDHEEWYFGFVKGYGTESGRTEAKIKDYLCYAAKFNVQTGVYEKVTFYGQVNMTVEGTYVLSYTLGDDPTVWRVTVIFETNDDGSIKTDDHGNPIVSVSKPV